MPRTRDQLDQAAASAEAWLDSLDPSSGDGATDPADLRAIAHAVRLVADAEHALARAVAAARSHGRSWPRIGMAMGISKQAAQERFGEVPAQ